MLFEIYDMHSSSGCFCPTISMMKAADARQGENLRSRCGTRMYWPPTRRLLSQRFVSTVLVIVGQVFVCEPFQMSLIQWDYVIRHLPATTANPALRDSVLPWTPDACANGFYAACLQELDYITAEFGIPVQYNVPLGTGQGERLSQLLYDPLARRVRGGVEVHNTAVAVLNYKQTIEHTKSQCRDSKKSNAAITSRWLLRKAAQRFALPSSW